MTYDIAERIANTQDEINELEQLPADKLVAEVSFDGETQAYSPVSDVANPRMTVGEMLVHLRKRLATLQFLQRGPSTPATTELRRNQFNANVPPAQPSTYDPFGPGADPAKIERMKPIKGAAFPS